MINAKRFCLATILAFVCASLFGSFVYCQVNYTWNWSSNVNFGLTNYDTYIDWTHDFFLNSFVFNSGENVTFNGVMLDGTHVDSVTLNTQTSNITVTQLDDSYLKYNVDGAGTQNIEYQTDEPSEVYLDGIKKNNGDGWSKTDNIITVNNATSSVIIYWYTGIFPSPTADTIWYDDPLIQYLWAGDLVGFVFACYYGIIAPLAIGIPVLFISIVLYVRQKSLLPVVLIWILTGGSLVAGIMELAPVAVLFSALAIGGLLVQLVLSWRRETY